MLELNIKNFIKIFVLFILIDLIWINLFAAKKYKTMIKDIQNENMKIKMIPAGVVYICMTLLLLMFGSSDIKNFALGFLSYGIYDMTNLSLINKFNQTFAIFDMIWGGILFASTYRVANMIKL